MVGPGGHCCPVWTLPLVSLDEAIVSGNQNAGFCTSPQFVFNLGI